MKDLIVGIAFIAVGYYFEYSMFRGEPEKFFYAFDIMGGLMILSGIIRGLMGMMKTPD